jgi:hypothetical protein
VELKKSLNSHLSQLLREEEIKWYQRSKARNLLIGDSNTKYFHLLGNGRHRKMRIYQLQDGHNTIHGDNELKKHITRYYKGLFEPLEDDSVSLDMTRREDITHVTEEENAILIEEFLENEVRKALFQMEHNYGFPAKFYQTFWELVKKDFMTLFEEFHQGSLPLYSLNFGTIILLPKCVEAIKIQQYRPIYLLNVSFKIFTKVITLTEVAHKVIQPTQSTFLAGRNIMKEVIILHETIHEMHRKKPSGVIFKIDFEKMYGKVK